MSHSISKVFFLLFLLILLTIQGSSYREQQNPILSNQRQLKDDELSRNLSLNPDFGKIPLYFIPNEGQVDDEALFYAKASRYTLWLTEEGLVFDITRRIKKKNSKPKRLSPEDISNHGDVKYDRDVSRLVFVNANRSPEVIPVDDTEHKVNYFIGNDESKWQTNIQTSRAVLYKELYPNIDLKVYGIEMQIEYDFVVKPGGEVSDIGLEYKDVEKTRIDKEGNLIVYTEFGEIKHVKPVCYQVIEGEKVKIKAKFNRIKDNTFGFHLNEYNKNYELIIDPLVLVYSTFLGGSGDESGRSIAVDSEGAVYVAGYTSSVNFPTKNPIQGSKAGGYDTFVTKINASGTALVYSTYLGGSGDELRCTTYIAVDSEGAVYVAGFTTSYDFPTKNPIQGNYAGNTDAFITKINASGTDLVYSTYLGGSEIEQSLGMAVDSEGAVYMAGYTLSVNFPTKNPIQGSNAGEYDTIITKINASGTALVYSTYLGGSGVDTSCGMAVDSEGAAYVTGYTNSVDFPTKNPIQGSNAGGYDAIITKINASGTDLVYSTYLGGSGEDWYGDIAVDSEGATYVTGNTGSVDFPTKNPIQGSIGGKEHHDAFVTKINPSGTDLVYSTYLGGSDGNDIGGRIKVDSEGIAYVLGDTESIDFPTKNPIQSTNAGDTDIFIAKVNSSGSALIYSTYLGSSRLDNSEGLAVDSEGAVYVIGFTTWDDFPTKNPVQGSYGGGIRDAFITKIASEKIRVVSWNILNYPDANEENREEYFRRILEYLSPDILVVQEMASFAGVDQFLKQVLKPISKKYRAARFFDGPDTDNVLFYDRSKFKLRSRLQIPTSFRDISEYRLKIKKGPGKGSAFKIYSVHFTEGLSAGDKSQRENEANILRAYLDGLSLDDLYLVCGSFNMTASNEKAYGILTGNQSTGAVRLIDPISKSGKWHDKRKFRYTHTESTRKTAYGDGASGGLDDRYDMILISAALDQNGSLILRPGSCAVCGNDGKHLNKAINHPTNKSVCAELAEALYMASDHLPVIIDLVARDESK